MISTFYTRDNAIRKKKPNQLREDDKIIKLIANPFPIPAADWHLQTTTISNSTQVLSLQLFKTTNRGLSYHTR